MSLASRPRPTVARVVLLSHLGVLLVVLVAIAIVGVLQFRQQAMDEATADSRRIASALAASPDVLARTVDRSPELENIVLSAFRGSDADFIVITDTAGIRLAHTDSEKVGAPYSGSVTEALRGEVSVDTRTGDRGPSVRTTVPVFDADGTVVGAVVVGTTVARITASAGPALGGLAIVLVGALAVSVVASLVIARWLNRVTLGRGPQELATSFSFYDAVISSANEGVVLIDEEERFIHVNERARILLGISDPDDVPDSFGDDRFDDPRVALLRGLDALEPQVVVIGDRITVVSRRPVEVGGRQAGAVLSIVDQTDLIDLDDRLHGAEEFLAVLRAQAHETANRIHTIVCHLELGEIDEAIAFATTELDLAQELTDAAIRGVGDPSLAAIVLAKTAQAREQGVTLTLENGVALPDGLLAPRDVVTVIGNLVDNALQAHRSPEPEDPDGTSAPADRRIDIAVIDRGNGFDLRVVDNGPGIPAASLDHVTEPGWTTKPSPSPHGRGLGLSIVEQILRRYGGRLILTRNDGGRGLTASCVIPRDGRSTS